MSNQDETATGTLARFPPGQPLRGEELTEVAGILWASHGRMLWLVARSRTHRDDEADDLVQETFARAIRSILQRGLPDRSVERWLLLILRNAFIDGLRRSKHPASATPASVLAGPEGDRDPLAGAADPDDVDRLEQLVRAEEIGWLRECLRESLSASERDALFSRVVDGDENDAIARRYEKTVGALKTWLTRARDKLRECLRRKRDGGPARRG